MEKEFVPYEQALALKELGFDEKCGACYYKKFDNEIGYHKVYRDFNFVQLTVSAPTFSQAFRWFRETYNLIPDIQYYGNWNFEIFRIGEFAEPMDDVNVDYTFKGGTYEESELECLKKLIEIVKSI